MARTEKASNRQRTRVGDIVEIPTGRGLAHAQVTHKHQHFGHLLAVFEGLCAERPEPVTSVLSRALQFQTFFPVAASVADGFCRIVGHAAVPEHLAVFPVFRTLGLTDQLSPDKEPWWLWDGEREWRVGELTPEQRRLPLRMSPGQPLLMERLVSGWRPELDPR